MTFGQKGQEGRQYSHLLPYVFLQGWFVQVHVAATIKVQGPHIRHHKSWLFRCNAKLVHLQQKHSATWSGMKTIVKCHLQVLVIYSVLLRCCAFFTNFHSDGKRRQNKYHYHHCKYIRGGRKVTPFPFRVQETSSYLHYKTISIILQPNNICVSFFISLKYYGHYT